MRFIYSLYNSTLQSTESQFSDYSITKYATNELWCIVRATTSYSQLTVGWDNQCLSLNFVFMYDVNSIPMLFRKSIQINNILYLLPMSKITNWKTKELDSEEEDIIWWDICFRKLAS